MAKTKPLVPGDIYGRWTVLGPVKKDGNETKWLCRCACGTQRYIARRSLVSGASLSCGCLRSERVRKVLAYDLTGKTFGQLTALGPAGSPSADGIRWNCRCTCGREISVAATLLVTGKKMHCGCRTERGQPEDITGRRFGRLTVLAPTGERDAKGSALWRCSCDCGNEVIYSYNTLRYTAIKSCGCQKREHGRALAGRLNRVDGTSLEQLKSRKTPRNSTTGVRGVYKTWGRYGAKISFRKKAYYLGVYDTLEEAAAARQEAERQLNDKVVAFYEKWQRRAKTDPAWAAENPVRIHVQKQGKTFLLDLEPSLTEGGEWVITPEP